MFALRLLTTLLCMPATALGQDAQVSQERPTLPAFSSAGEDGAATLWVNPSALAFDPDPSAWLGWSQPGLDTPGTLSGALQRGPFAFGALYRNGSGRDGWLSIANGLGIKLSKRIALGIGLGWQIPEGPENNFVTWDATFGWRPTQWLGVSLIAQNINDPGAELGVYQSFGGGMAVRPLGSKLTVGVDYRQRDLDATETGRFSATARIEPTEGLVVRLQGDQAGTIGAGVELFWGRLGFGALGSANVADGIDSGLGMGYLITGDGDPGFFDYGRRVAVFELDGAFPYQRATGLLARPDETWLHLIRRMEMAIEDPAVRGIALTIDRAPSSWARVAELRSLMKRARDAGKLTATWLGRDTGNLAYMLAASTDRVYLHPAANLDLIGLSMELNYFRGTLDLIGVEAQYLKRSEFKSAPEQWTHHGPSESARAQLDAMLDELDGQLVQAIAEGRARTPEQVRTWVDQGPHTASLALERGLVDATIYSDELEQNLEQALQRNLDLERYYRLDDDVSGWPAAREIAIIYVDGVIVSGNSSPGGLLGARTAGAATIVRQLDAAIADDAVHAVVLRVDSPGGSAYASDDIWRATQRVKESGKPLIVSLGGVAASGGYYVAAGGDAIYAEPGTITGSIGVFSGKFSVAQLQETLGIQTEVLSRGRHAALYTMARPLDEAELEVMDKLVEDTYVQFKERVAEGRSMAPGRVEEVARGRVWTGEAARREGLVDQIGGLAEAIQHARASARISTDAVVELITYGDREVGPLPRRAVQSVARLAVGPDPLQGLQTPELPAVLQSAQTWSALSEDPVWALMPWDLAVR